MAAAPSPLSSPPAPRTARPVAIWALAVSVLGLPLTAFLLTAPNHCSGHAWPDLAWVWLPAAAYLVCVGLAAGTLVLHRRRGARMTAVVLLCLIALGIPFLLGWSLLAVMMSGSC